MVVENIATNALTSISGVAAATIGAGYTNPGTASNVTGITIGAGGIVTITGGSKTGPTNITYTPLLMVQGVSSPGVVVRARSLTCHRTVNKTNF